MKLRIKYKNCWKLNLYFDRELREFYLSIPDLEKRILQRRIITGRGLLILIGIFDNKGECEVKIKKSELFKYKLLARNFLNTYVEVIK